MADKIIMLQDEPRGPSQLVEVPVTEIRTQVPFPDVQQLRSQGDETVIIKGVRLIVPGVSVAGAVTGLPIAPLTELQKIFLIVYCEGWEKGQLIPVLTLNDMTVEGSGIPYAQNQTHFDNWRNVDWSKSKLQYANGTQSVPSYAVIFDVQYVKLNAMGAEIQGSQ